MAIEETQGMKVVLDEYLAITRKDILARASEFASEEEFNVTHVARAVEEHAGNIRPEVRTFRDYFPPVALLSSILAFTFAALGLWAILGTSESATKLGGQGFLDIAKIFAGAIVGSATVATAAGRKRANK